MEGYSTVKPSVMDLVRVLIWIVLFFTGMEGILEWMREAHSEFYIIFFILPYAELSKRLLYIICEIE